MQSKILSTLILISLFTSAQAQSLLNASYDISRELFAKYNVLFQEHYQETTGDSVEIKQSHAGSSKQANAILHGLRADVVTFNQVTDVDVLADKGNFIPKDWASRLPNNSSPYYSTIAFLVHKDNPKNIHNWDDLIQSDVSLVFPNPKTSGNGRYTYLAALGYAQDAFANDSGKQDEFMKNLLSHVVVFDVGGRGATTSFVERNQGDVLITFESEVNNIKAQYPDQHFEVVVPPVSILAEFPVTWIDKNTARNGSTELAKSYLNYLYSEPAQQLLASFNYRVHNKDVAAKYREKFPEIKLKTIEDIGGSWKNVMQSQFGHDGKLDQLLRPE